MHSCEEIVYEGHAKITITEQHRSSPVLLSLVEAYNYMVSYKKCQNRSLLDDMLNAINA